MKKQALLEICAFNIQSALIAQRAGAARIELCDNPLEGGTTPSYGTIKCTREKLSIPLYPLIRPRGGNYLYDAAEMAIIQQDITICKNLGCDGISIGVQNIDGTINADQIKQIVAWAHPMGVTCNRVFDATPNAAQALETLIDAGCERVLSSGQQATAMEGAALLQQLIEQAAGRIIIMPGAGIRSHNIAQIRRATGATEFHGSAKMRINHPLHFSNPLLMDMGNVYQTDEEEVRKMVATIQN